MILLTKQSAEKRICIVHAGGKLGQIYEGGEKHPPRTKSDYYKIAPEIPAYCDIDPVFLLDKSGDNITRKDWAGIARTIYGRRNEYHGFVVVHDTTGMDYTASALAYAFGPNLNFPVVLTGAQTEPSVVHGDARVNLLRACATAVEPLAEVCIAFRNHVFRGCRTQQKDASRFDAFESRWFPPLADITETIDINPLAKLQSPQVGEMDFRPYFSDGVMTVPLSPGLEPEFYEKLSAQPKGYILETSSAGNIPTEDRYSLEPFIQHATQRGIPVVLASRFPVNYDASGLYELHNRALSVGAIPAREISFPATAVKLCWVLSRVDEEIKQQKIPKAEKLDRIKEWMWRNYVGDVGSTTTTFTDPDPRGL